jgi:Outer membrane protein beta-barrel domain
MTSSRSWLVSGAVLAVAIAIAAPVSAQVGRLGAHVNFGAQTGSGDLAQQLKPTIYDETATVDISQTYESGPLVDVGGEYMLFGHFGVGVSYSHTSGDGNATLAGQIPDPLYYDRPRGAAAQASSLNHTENAVHISLLYRYAVMPKMDITVGLGPSFISLKQDLISQVAVSEAAGGPTLTPTAAQFSDSVGAVNISGDATYMITKNIGAGLLLRFAKATATLQPPDAATPIEVRAGGFQVAVGVRARF